MNENEKENKIDEENISSEESQNTDENTGFEQNDNWQFEAEAPTIGENIGLGDGFEIEASALSETENKKPKKE